MRKMGVSRSSAGQPWGNVQTTAWRSVKKFIRSTSGNVAVVFSLSAVPVIVMAGGAIDFANAKATRTALQSVCDAAALAATQAPIKNQAGFEAEVSRYVVENAPAAYKSISPAVSIGPLGTSLSVTLTGNVPTTTMSIVNINTIPVTVGCTVRGRKLDPMELTFVLDYSQSMNNSVGGQVKWEAMRDSALALVNEIKNNSDPGEIKVGIVPFSSYVRTTLPGEYLRGTDITDVTTCLLDRDYPHNVSDVTPSGTDLDPTKWPRQEDNFCTDAATNELIVMPLTTDMDAISTQITNMRAGGNTNIQLGLAMGWHVLSPNQPFDEGTAYNDPDMPKIMVMLSDGEQTMGGNGSQNTSVDSAKANIDTLCQNIKDSGITLITIAFDIQQQTTRDRLRDCASSPEMFFEPYNGEQLFAAFNGIGSVLGLGSYLSE